MIEDSQLGGRAIFSPLGSQHIILVGQRTAFEVITQIVQTVIVQTVGCQHRITIYHTYILTQHGQLRHAVIIQIVSIDKQGVALLHTHIAECLHRIYLFEYQRTITEHVHTVMLHPHRTDEYLHIRTQLFVRLRLICVQQIDARLLLFRRLRLFLFNRVHFPLLRCTSTLLFVLRTQQTDAKQA